MRTQTHPQKILGYQVDLNGKFCDICFFVCLEKTLYLKNPMLVLCYAHIGEKYSPSILYFKFKRRKLFFFHVEGSGKTWKAAYP